MDEFLDRELAPGEVSLVRSHLETCAACASEYAFEESVLVTVREKLRRIAVPSELRDRIALRIAEARASKATES
jgi:mycothiol system anti-sigma-R factor